MKSLRIFYLFGAVGFFHLLSLLMAWHDMAVITKPLLLPLLAVWFWRAQLGVRSKFTQTFLAGLIASFFGDTFLLGQGKTFFLAGLVSFLIAHVLYILAFKNYPGYRSGFLDKRPLWSLPFVVIVIGVNWFLWPDLLPDLRIPVLIYSIVISLMVASAFNMIGRVSESLYPILIGGAILFLLSDIILSIEKFKEPYISASLIRFAVMSTYLTGQALLAIGVIKAASILDSSPIADPPD